ncbi:MAG: MFS transporter, partial [Dehalococcoidia bacterium]|nr:MFS transporter [Dehalococcoidia bacterium]
PARMVSSVRAAMWREMKEGLAYIRNNSTILALVIVAIVPMFLGQPYMSMLTVFARDVLEIGPVGLGLLTSASAFGAVSGALVLASLGDFRHKGTLMLGTMFAFGAMLFLFSLSSWPVVSILLVTVVGAMSTMYNSSNNTILQLMVPDNLRGRVMSTLFVSRGMVPLGTAMAGALATVIGAPLAVGAMAATVVILALVVRIAVPALVALE